MVPSREDGSRAALGEAQRQDDTLVRVHPMLERVGNWRGYLAGSMDGDRAELIRQHTRTGRSLGSEQFISRIEAITCQTLSPKRPGPKPGDR